MISRNPTLADVLVATMAVLSLTIACGDGPKQSRSPNPVAPGPSAPPAVVGVEISGPASIPPGQSARFSANLRFSDATTKTATSVLWYAGSQFFRVDPSGVATAGKENGEGVLYAEVNPNGTAPEHSGMRGAIRSSKEILVLPDGTYRMVGTVTENGPEPTPLFGARVETTSGPPLAAITDYDGRYQLYGIPGLADIRVSRDSYQPHVQRLQLTEHVTQNFQLALSGSRLDLAGLYTLAIDVACSTSTPVAADLQHRTYAASVTQSGSTLTVVLIEPSRFHVNGTGRGDRFTGRVDSAGAMFDLGDSFWNYYGAYDPSTYPTLVERLPTGFLVVDGKVLTRGSRTGLSGELRGSVQQYGFGFPSAPSSQSVKGTCYSPAHRFTLTPR